MNKQLLIAGMCLLGSCTLMLAKDKDTTMAKSLDAYIQAARSNQLPVQSADGSLYADAGPNWNLFSDFKARRMNDIVTIHVVESTVATSKADAQTGRKGSMSASAPALFGLESHVSSVPWSNLLETNSAAQFAGSGTTTREGTLSAYIAARVRDVLPNGDLVIEGVKEVKVNNERQMLSLIGVVRQQDIGPNNVVPSTVIANMQILLDGKGIVSENIKPGLLFRFLSKFWPI
jgi:flagellar L-ring protein precursor FlgH